MRRTTNTNSAFLLLVTSFLVGLSVTACNVGQKACTGEWERFESDGVTYCARMDSERDANCPVGFGDKATDDWRVVVCDDTQGGSEEMSVEVAHQHFGTACAQADSAGECECEWIGAERHRVYSEGTCSVADEGVCLFVSGYYGEEIICLEREIEDGTDVITVSNGYEYTPGWTRSMMCHQECREEFYP